MKLKRSCREVSALILAREDRRLSLGERVVLHLHLAVCQACPTFERQVRIMGDAMKRWRAYSSVYPKSAGGGNGIADIFRS